MSRFSLIQTNFTAGEISPRLMGRVDISRYANGAKTIENALLMIHGGVVRRPGTRFVAKAKYQDTPVRLIPYVFNRNQAYVLELGHYYMRVYFGGAQIMSGNQPYEIATPYSSAMLREIDYSQGADTLFIAHPSIPLYRLRRIDHDVWNLSQTPFIMPPTDEIGHRLGANLTLYSMAVGTTEATTDMPVFLPSDVGRQITYKAGQAEVIVYHDAYHVTVSTSIAFPVSVLPACNWVLTGSPIVEILPSTTGPVGASITLTAPNTSTIVKRSQQVQGLTLQSVPSSNSGGVTTPTHVLVTVSIPNHSLSTGNTVEMQGNLPDWLNGSYVVTVLNAHTFTYRVMRAEFGMPSTTPGKATIYHVIANGTTWRTEDIGKIVRINSGMVQIVTVQSPSVAIGVVKQELSAAVAAPAYSWQLESAVWNNFDGYPRSVTMYEQRLVLGGSPGFPATVWMSRIGEHLNFEPGTKDDDAMSFTISGDQVNPIAHLAQNKTLIALTDGGESTLYSGTEKPITPTNIQVKTQSVYGCNSVHPVRIGNELYFVQRAGRKIRAMAYKFDSDSYGSPDLSVLSEHITESGIVDMAFQQEPDSVLWLVRDDGVMATLSVDRDQDVLAWARQITDGVFESVTSIPVEGNEQAWCVVVRTINNETERYIERFDSEVMTDCAITGSGKSSSTWGGLSHLEGKEVDVLADGIVQRRAVVSNGEIFLDRKAESVQIGLPYTTTIQTLTPEISGQSGSAQGNQMRISEVTLRLLNTLGATIDGKDVAFRSVNSALKELKPFTGEHRLETLGWERGEASLCIQQTQPLPFHLLAVIYKFSVNGG